jgi:hypothetical protein
VNIWETVFEEYKWEIIAHDWVHKRGLVTSVTDVSSLTPTRNLLSTLFRNPMHLCNEWATGSNNYTGTHNSIKEIVSDTWETPCKSVAVWLLLRFPCWLQLLILQLYFTSQYTVTGSSGCGLCIKRCPLSEFCLSLLKATIRLSEYRKRQTCYNFTT